MHAIGLINLAEITRSLCKFIAQLMQTASFKMVISEDRLDRFVKANIFYGGSSTDISHDLIPTWNYENTYWEFKSFKILVKSYEL